jgi:hypothetical protein
MGMTLKNNTNSSFVTTFGFWTYLLDKFESLQEKKERVSQQEPQQKNTTMYPRIIENPPFTTFTKVIHKVIIISFTLYTLFQWYLQSNEILLNLSMKCSSSAFNAQRLESNYNSCTSRSSENICKREVVEVMRKK